MSVLAPRQLSPAFAQNTATDRRGALDWITLSLIFITTFAYGARCAIKFFQKRSIAKGLLEEFLLLLSWIFSILQGAAQLRANYFGFGTRHMKNSNPALQWYFASQLLSVFSLACSKLAIITFIIWSMKPQGRLNTLAWTTFAFGVLYGLVGIFGTAFQCDTPQTWLVAPGRCASQSGIITAIAVINVASDLVIICLPFPIVFKVQFTDKSATKSRIIILSVFLARALVVALTIGFLVSYNEYHTDIDPTWADVQPVQWNQGMVYTSTIVSCLPAMFSFLKFMASGAMGVRMGGDTQLRHMSGSPKDLPHALKSGDSKHGTVTHVSGQRPSEEDTAKLVPEDGINIVTEVHVNSMREGEASSEKTP